MDRGYQTREAVELVAVTPCLGIRGISLRGMETG